MSQTLGETMMASFMASTKEIPDIFITTRGSSARRGLSLSYFLLGVRLSKRRENNSGSFENISLNGQLQNK